MYLLITVLITLFGIVFLFLPQLENLRMSNNELVVLTQTMIGTLTGVFLAMQLSVWKQKKDDISNVEKLLEGIKIEARETLNSMQAFKQLIAECDIKSNEQYQRVLTSNDLPKLLLVEGLLANDLFTRYTSPNAIRSFPKILGNLSTLSKWSKDKIGYQEAYKIVYGYIFEIEFIVNIVNIELAHLKKKYTDRELTKLYNFQISELMQKKNEILALTNE